MYVSNNVMMVLVMVLSGRLHAMLWLMAAFSTMLILSPELSPLPGACS
jgi:hypothetical protein